MMDRKQIERFRRMSPAERWTVWAELAELGMAIWDANLDEEETQARWDAWRRDHDRSDRRMLAVFRGAR